MQQLNSNLFQSIVGQPLTVCHPDTGLELAILTLNKVLVNHQAPAHYDAFSLILAGDQDRHLFQGTYLFKHVDFGEAVLFMTPNAIDHYQIVMCMSVNGAA